MTAGQRWTLMRYLITGAGRYNRIAEAIAAARAEVDGGLVQAGTVYSSSRPDGYVGQRRRSWTGNRAGRVAQGAR